ncbi:MAG: helix-turn-helix transcriptional regulator [Pseudomonadales bacterium]
MSQALTIHHDLGDVIVTPSCKVNKARLKQMIRSTLDQYLVEDRVPAAQVHAQTKQRHGDQYQTAGYYLRLYRQRAELTQVGLAEQSGIRQHHLSEMENNKRALGKNTAKKMAEILDCDYRKLL